jgi:hypothetical protein
MDPIFKRQISKRQSSASHAVPIFSEPRAAMVQSSEGAELTRTRVAETHS